MPFLGSKHGSKEEQVALIGQKSDSIEITDDDTPSDYGIVLGIDDKKYWFLLMKQLWYRTLSWILFHFSYYLHRNKKYGEKAGSNGDKKKRDGSFRDLVLIILNLLDDFFVIRETLVLKVAKFSMKE